MNLLESSRFSLFTYDKMATISAIICKPFYLISCEFICFIAGLILVWLEYDFCVPPAIVWLFSFFTFIDFDSIVGITSINK